MGLLKDYIGYARNYVHPKISEKAGQALIEAYVDMRKVGSGRGQVSAYPRQLESLIRLSEAHARMRLSEVVEVKDVDEARRYKIQKKQFFCVNINSLLNVVKLLLIDIVKMLKLPVWNN